MKKIFEKLTKIVNNEEENLHIFWTSWGISMKFSGKMWLVIILKVTKKQKTRASFFLWKKYILGKNTGVRPKLAPTCSSSVNIITNNHGRTQKWNYSVLDWKNPYWYFKGFFGPDMPKNAISSPKRKLEHLHWILYVWISQGTKFKLKLTILIFSTKFL